MLCVYYGNDVIKVRKEAHAAVTALEEKGAVIESIDSDSYAPGVLADAIGNTSLFGEQTAYVIDTPSVNKDFYADVIEHLEALSSSSNTFVLIESTLLAPAKKKFQKYTTDLFEYKVSAAERFNVFAMADALSRKDKKSLWLLLQEAKAQGLSEEEIIGTLWWQLKTLRLASVTNSASEAGMKDFPYNKAKRSLSTFRDGELAAISQSLMEIYHDARLGMRDMDIALERWMLRL